MNLLRRVQSRRNRLWAEAARNRQDLGHSPAAGLGWLPKGWTRERTQERKRRDWGVVVVVLATALIVGTTLFGSCVAKIEAAAHKSLTPAERTAIETVESGGDPKAWKKDEDARGIIQIRPIYVADANRILGVERFKHDDAFDPVKAWQMFEVVTSHYIRAYGYGDTFEVRCRIHNGGGKGPTRKSTLGYWRKVQAAAT